MANIAGVSGADPPRESLAPAPPISPATPAFEDRHRPFGGDRFGILAERFARFFGTPRFIIGQSGIIVVWIALNAAVVTFRWDPYPFILLNLVFSTQAAYAAPLILLAQTRQADRDHIRDTHAHDRAELEKASTARVEQRQLELLDLNHRLAEQHARALAEHSAMLAQNTGLTERVVHLTEELHETLGRG